MRRITMWLLVTATVFVLLFSYHTSTDSGAGPGTATSVAAPSTAPTTAAPGTAGTDSPSSDLSPTSTDTTTSAAQTYTGSSVDTRWGPVQVRIAVADGQITSATAVVYPQNNHRDVEINAEAVPVLEQETVTSQSADIDMVSGATVTSDGYIQSLQSAIDQARLG